MITINVAEAFREAERKVAESFHLLMNQWKEQIILPIRNSLESLSRQIIDSQKRLIEDFAERLKEYEIAEGKAACVLKKYKWLVSPSLPITFVYELNRLGMEPVRKEAAINRLFVDYFSSNNWHNLETMVIKWKGLIKKERFIILNDCVQILKLTIDKKINQANVVLPTLIAQIDGIFTDYLITKGVKWDVEYDDFIRDGKVMKAGRKSRFRKHKQIPIPDQLDDVACGILLDILFKSSRKSQLIKIPLNFNRHRIMHGSSVKYGRKDYLVRAFLILDFMAHLD